MVTKEILSCCCLCFQSVSSTAAAGRLLVDRVNNGATRRSDLLAVRRGKPKPDRVKGKGKYRAFTAKTMLRTTCFGLDFGFFGFIRLFNSLLSRENMYYGPWTMYCCGDAK